MPQFQYQATDRDGVLKEGQIEAGELNAAIDRLASQGLYVREIRVADDESSASMSATRTSMPASTLDRDKAFTTPAVQAAFKNAIARREQLVPALQAVAAEMPPGSTRRDVLGLADLLQSAEDVDDLQKSKKASRCLPLLSAGLCDESSSQPIAELIATAARESQRQNDRMRLLAYPIILLIVALLVFGLLCAFVVPTFEAMFGEFGLEVSGLTQVVIAISHQFRQHLPRTIFIVILVIAVILTICRLWSRYALGYRLFGSLAAGSSSGVAAMAVFSGQLAEWIRIGVPIPEAIQLAGEGCQHNHFRRVAKQLARDAKRQHVPLTSSKVANEFPANLLYAIDTRSEKEPNVALLHELAVIYRKRCAHRINWTAEIFSYLAVLAIGLAVGLVAVALFLPLINLVSGLS